MLLALFTTRARASSRAYENPRRRFDTCSTCDESGAGKGRLARPRPRPERSYMYRRASRGSRRRPTRAVNSLRIVTKASRQPNQHAPPSRCASQARLAILPASFCRSPSASSVFAQEAIVASGSHNLSFPYHSTLHVQQEGYHASPLALRALQFREPASQICLPNFCPHGIRGSVVQFFSPTSSGEGMCSRRRHAASESLSQSMPPNAPVQVLKLTRVCN